MAYTKTNWVNDSQPPISADNLNNMENGIFNANALADNIDDAYDDTATYAVGDYAIYNNTLYKCITAVTSAEPFDSSKWSSVSVMDEIGQNASAISALNSRISTTTFSASVDITNYTSYANAFVCPSDGYLQLESGNTVNDYMIAIVSTSNTDIGFIISAKTQITNYKEYNAVYVRKGMKCYASAKNGSTSKLSFRGFA